MTAVITVEGLTKRFGELVAVDGISFEVREGEIFGLLGKNGAGKTTTIEILEGYQGRDGGRVEVLGHDPATATLQWRDRLGLVLQESDFDPVHTVAETVGLFASFFSTPRSVAETLELVGLTEQADQRIGRLSGGQKRRVDVAAGIVGRPALLFLDEPTTGFDPAARREFWGMLEGLRDTGTSMVLTTHYMEEAERLCDRIAIMAHGKVVSEGTAETLIAATGRSTVRVQVADASHRATACQLLGASARSDQLTVEATMDQAEVQGRLGSLLAWAAEVGVVLDRLEVERPNLDDVFLDVTEGR